MKRQANQILEYVFGTVSLWMLAEYHLILIVRISRNLWKIPNLITDKSALINNLMKIFILIAETCLIQ